MLFILLAVALFFAMNIGASGTAASMGAAYGSQSLSRRIALILVAIAVFAGATFGGSEVVKTLSKGLIPENSVTIEIALIMLLAATSTLFIANITGIPLSTSEVTVGSVVGVGIALKSLQTGKLFLILSTWILLPITAYLIAYVLGKIVEKPLNHQLKTNGTYLKRVLTILVILASTYEAFSAGMNNVANAVSPLVAANLIDTSRATILGGAFVALGAIVLGGKVLETNAKKITNISLPGGIIVSFTSGTLVLIASLYGIPVPLTQATTSAIMGLGKANNINSKPIIHRIIWIWIASPLVSLFIAYTLTILYLDGPSLLAILRSILAFTSVYVFLLLTPSLFLQPQEISFKQSLDR